MKRKVPNATIEQFFTSSMNKPPTTAESITRPTKKNLVVVKSSQQKNVIRISIPSLSVSADSSTNSVLLTDEEFNSRWDQLSQSVTILFAGNFDQLNFTKLHNEVEFYCRFKSPKSLFDRLFSQLQEIIDNFLDNDLTNAANVDISAISQAVSNFESCMINLRKIFLYLDRSYIFANRIEGFLSLPSIIHNMIRKRFLSDDKKYIESIIQQIKLQVNIIRCTNSADSANSDLFTVLKFMDDLGLYESHIENPILLQTAEFYSTIGSELSLSQFIEWLSVAQMKERELLEAGVKPSTLESIYKIINETALKENSEMLFGDEFRKAVETHEDDNVKKLYSFFDNDEIRPIFSENLGKHFCQKANEILLQNKIDGLIDEFENAKNYVSTVFPNNPKLLNDIKSSFGHNLSSKSEIISKLLAKHFNKGGEIKQKEIDFFELNQSKDIFEVSYYNLLTYRRILEWESVDVKRERKLISFIKAIAGSEYIERLQTLINDLEMSNKVQAQNLTSRQHPTAVEFKAISLSSRNFPNESFNENAIYPKEITGMMKAFETGFQSLQKQVSNIVFRWSPNLTLVECKFGKNTCRMTGSQCLILLAMQNDHLTTIKEISESTKLSSDTVDDNLNALLSPEAGSIVMFKNQKDKENGFVINPNYKFEQKSNYVKFPSTAAVIAQKERESQDSYLETIRYNKIQCTIMAKMKTFKLMTLSEMYTKVGKELDFSPDERKFTACVKSLEAHCFLEKVGDKSYRYIP